jgi:hypothetical protein
MRSAWAAFPERLLTTHLLPTVWQHSTAKTNRMKPALVWQADEAS